MYRLEKNQLEQAINRAWRNPFDEKLQEGFNDLLASNKNKNFAQRFALEKVQEALWVALGQPPGKGATDFTGKQFSQAVYEYQKKKMLSGHVKIADGVIGEMTMASLLLTDNDFYRAYKRVNNAILEKEFPSISVQHKSMSYYDFRETIAKIESQGSGDYKATNNHTSAVGRYQFIWSQWGKLIKPFARKLGYRNVTPQVFLANPKLQDAFFAHYFKNQLKKQASAIKRRYPSDVEGWSDEQIMALIHFKGYGAAVLYITKGIDKYPDHNKSIPEYLSHFPGTKTPKTTHEINQIAKK